MKKRSAQTELSTIGKISSSEVHDDDAETVDIQGEYIDIDDARTETSQSTAVYTECQSLTIGNINRSDFSPNISRSKNSKSLHVITVKSGFIGKIGVQKNVSGNVKADLYQKDIFAACANNETEIVLKLLESSNCEINDRDEKRVLTYFSRYFVPINI